jgi:hypothetical protein
MAIKKTHEWFITELEKRNKNYKNIIIISKYDGVDKKIKCRCSICDFHLEGLGYNLLSGQGCPKCGGKLKKEHSEFLSELKEINPNIEVLSQYISARSDIICKCLICLHIWEVWPTSLLRGSGCPRCAHHYTRTHDEFINELKIIFPDIKITSNYVNASTKVSCLCLIDGHTWEATPNNLLRGHGCKICCHNRKRMTHEEFVDRAFQINPNIKVTGIYKQNKRKIEVQCLLDNYKWFIRPDQLLSGVGCPVCGQSRGETRIQSILTKKDIEFERQKKFENLVGINNGYLSFDFYLQHYNLLIEYQGEFHDGAIRGEFQSEDDFKKQQEHDRRKKEYSKQNSINLLEIWYWDFENIEEIINKVMITISRGE